MPRTVGVMFGLSNLFTIIAKKINSKWTNATGCRSRVWPVYFIHHHCEKINGKCTNATNRRSRVWSVYFIPCKQTTMTNSSVTCSEADWLKLIKVQVAGAELTFQAWSSREIFRADFLSLYFRHKNQNSPTSRQDRF